MKITLVRWSPWILVAIALGVFLLIPDANGPALVAVWGTIIVVVRLGIRLLPDRTARLWADVIVILGCSLAAFEGGWYLLPAAIVFTIKDRAVARAIRPFGT